MRDTSPLARRSGLFTVAASVAFQLLLIAAILLRPEIDPAQTDQRVRQSAGSVGSPYSVSWLQLLPTRA